jgi:hypothetical protein
MLIALLSGCNGAAVDPQERDVSNQYSGHWNGNIVITQELQKQGNVTWTCPKFDEPVVFNVNDGYVSGNFGGNQFKTPIAKSGSFYTQVNMQRGTLVRLQGRFNSASNSGSGVVVLSRSGPEKHLYETGCRANLTVSRT